jgi:hypothetical protein
MWLRGERLPGSDTKYVDMLAEKLRLTASDRDTLKEALMESLRQGRPQKHIPRSGIDAAGELLAAAWSAHGSTLDDRRILDSRPRVSNRIVISGTENVILAATELVARAPEHPAHTASDIFVTYRGSKSVFESHPQLLSLWNAAISSALRKDYRVHALWHLDRNVARSIHLAKDTLALVGRGEYLPMYTPGGGVVDPPHDLLIVPGMEALTMYATTQGVQVDTAIRVREPGQLNVLLHHVEQCAAISQSILTFYAGNEHEASHRAGVAADIEAGRRIVLKDGLSTLTRPRSWFNRPERLKDKTLREGEEFDAWVERERERLPAFLEAARTGSFKDMCPQSRITRLLGKGEYYRWDGIKSVETDMDMAREHVKNLIWLLKTLDGYELALLDEVETRTIDPRFCMVHGDISVILEFDQLVSGQIKPVKMQINESRIVSAFREHLEGLWSTVRLRKKTDCIQWLERQLERTE